MIDLTDYNLIYHELETGKVFKAKRITSNDFKFFDTTTGLKIDVTLSRIRRKFKGDPANLKLRVDNFKRSKCKNYFHYVS